MAAAGSSGRALALPKGKGAASICISRAVGRKAGIQEQQPAGGSSLWEPGKMQSALKPGWAGAVTERSASPTVELFLGLERNPLEGVTKLFKGGFFPFSDVIKRAGDQEPSHTDRQ